ncbi:hypothetical protein OSTOST_01456 [Ostertagia ostertagi]
MYSNLCDMFNGEAVDGQAASIDLGDEIVIPSSKAILDEDPLTKKDSFGFPLSIFTNIDDQDIGQIEFVDANLKREVPLTSADLRFGDYILKNIEENKKSSAGKNYRIWMLGQHDDLIGVAPGHAFSGQLGVYDVLLRVEHTVSGSEGARRAISALTSTGKNIGETGQKMRQSFTTWFKGGVQNAEEATESTESSPKLFIITHDEV